MQLQQERQHLLALGLLGRIDLRFIHQQHVLGHHASEFVSLAAPYAALIITSPHTRRFGKGDQVSRTPVAEPHQLDAAERDAADSICAEASGYASGSYAVE